MNEQLEVMSAGRGSVHAHEVVGLINDSVVVPTEESHEPTTVSDSVVAEEEKKETLS